jgi:hypothetical protein
MFERISNWSSLRALSKSFANVTLLFNEIGFPCPFSFKDIGFPCPLPLNEIGYPCPLSSKVSNKGV